MRQTVDWEALIETIPEATLAAKLRALMPAIDQRINDGVRHQDIVDALNAHGGLAAEVKLQTFRSYLFRYRRAARASRGNEEVRGGRWAAQAAPALPAVSSAARTPSDLKRLRNEEVDLEELSRIGRNKRGG